MSIFALGVNHKTASVNVREKVYFAIDQLAFYLQDLLARKIVQEAVLLSTCNRSELYCQASDLETVRAWFCEQTDLPRAEVEAAMYVYSEQDAITHIMQVACGMDSMIMGETQILGQMKAAFSESCSAGAVSTLFHRLFQQIFTVAKDIRTTTSIGACPVSVASAAVYFAKQRSSDFAQAKVAIIGAGETSALLMRYLTPHLQQPMTIVNRSKENADLLLSEFGGHYVPMSALSDALQTADIVFSATGSPIPVIHKAMLADIVVQKPLLLIDLAVPRDIDPAVAELAHVHLHCIDDLKEMIALHRQGREHAASKALELIQTKSKFCLAEIYSLDKVANTIRAYRGQIEDICQAELRKAKQQLLLGSDPQQVLEAFSHAFMNKLMHTPSVQLRQAGVEERYDLLRLAKRLFAIPDPEIEIL